MDWSKESERATRQTFFQGRLDKKLEDQKIKLRDNNIRNTGTPEDILIIEPKTGDEGDKTANVLKAHIVTNVIFPPLKDLPIKMVTSEFESGYTMTNIVSSYGKGKDSGNDPQKDLSTIDIQIPLREAKNVSIYQGCKIVKVFVDEGLVSSVMVFDVIDMMGTFSNNAALAVTAKVALTTEPVDLTKKVYQMCVALAKRRLEAGY